MSRIYMRLVVGHTSMPGPAERAAFSTRDGVHGFDVSTGCETRWRKVAVVNRARYRSKSCGNLRFFAFQSISTESRRNLPQ
jgi:hypothetical protein